MKASRIKHSIQNPYGHFSLGLKRIQNIKSTFNNLLLKVVLFCMFTWEGHTCTLNDNLHILAIRNSKYFHSSSVGVI